MRAKNTHTHRHQHQLSDGTTRWHNHRHGHRRAIELDDHSEAPHGEPLDAVEIHGHEQDEAAVTEQPA